jgi:hypothetical protein
MIDLLARARADIQRIAQGEFSSEVTFTNLAATPVTVTVRALASKHHFQIDAQTGMPVNSKNTHCSVAEASLLAAGYTVRNAAGDVNLRNHKVTYKDSTGNARTYRINEAMPDETVGLIVLTLGDYE